MQICCYFYNFSSFSHVLISPPIRLPVLLVYFKEKSRGCIENSKFWILKIATDLHSNYLLYHFPPLSMMLNILNFGYVSTVWCFGYVSTVWYYGYVSTVWYFGYVLTVWYFVFFTWWYMSNYRWTFWYKYNSLFSLLIELLSLFWSIAVLKRRYTHFSLF
jgi:hypothetical protein